MEEKTLFKYLNDLDGEEPVIIFLHTGFSDNGFFFNKAKVLLRCLSDRMLLARFRESYTDDGVNVIHIFISEDSLLCWKK